MAAKNYTLGTIKAEKSVLFLCDMQEKFRPVMENFEKVVVNMQKLLNGCKIFEVPLVVSEQYPKGLGKTIKELDISHVACYAEKTKFNMCVPEVGDFIKGCCNGDLQTVIICGIEAHICIEQTAIELISRGYYVHVVADCCTSRSQEDRLLAFKRLAQIGCFITTSESILFKLLQNKDHPKFNDIAALVKSPSCDTGLAKM